MAHAPSEGCDSSRGNAFVLGESLADSLNVYNTLPTKLSELYLYGILKIYFGDAIVYEQGVPKPRHKSKNTHDLSALSEHIFETLKCEIIDGLLQREGLPKVRSCENDKLESMQQFALSAMPLDEFKAFGSKFFCEYAQRSNKIDTGNAVDPATHRSKPSVTNILNSLTTLPRRESLLTSLSPVFETNLSPLFNPGSVHLSTPTRSSALSGSLSNPSQAKDAADPTDCPWWYRNRSVSTFVTACTRISSQARSSCISSESKYFSPIHRQSQSSSYYSIENGVQNTQKDCKRGTKTRSSWKSTLDAMGLTPDPILEQDWSGRGQHAEFQVNEAEKIPLTEEGVLGHTASAFVTSVRCRRIRLARKTVTCNRRFKREDAIKEVQQLQRLGHAHIVQVVGTYVMQNKLSLLLYPVAEWNLEAFIGSIHEGSEAALKALYLRRFIRCLAETVGFLHRSFTKHMDIKPKNLLVRDLRTGKPRRYTAFKVYIADFGIAKSYKSGEEAETGGRTSFTRKYAAPEVVLQETRGLGADIFSLGCVYAEILAVLADIRAGEFKDSVGKTPYAAVQWDGLQNLMFWNEDFDDSYQANVSKIRRWLDDLSLGEHRLDDTDEAVRSLTTIMLDPNPAARPSAGDVMNSLHALVGCLECDAGPEPFEPAA